MEESDELGLHLHKESLGVDAYDDEENRALLLSFIESLPEVSLTPSEALHWIDSPDCLRREKESMSKEEWIKAEKIIQKFIMASLSFEARVLKIKLGNHEVDAILRDIDIRLIPINKAELKKEARKDKENSYFLIRVIQDLPDQEWLAADICQWVETSDIFLQEVSTMTALEKVRSARAFQNCVMRYMETKIETENMHHIDVSRETTNKIINKVRESVLDLLLGQLREKAKKEIFPVPLNKLTIHIGRFSAQLTQKINKKNYRPESARRSEGLSSIKKVLRTMGDEKKEWSIDSFIKTIDIGLKKIKPKEAQELLTMVIENLGDVKGEEAAQKEKALIFEDAINQKIFRRSLREQYRYALRCAAGLEKSNPSITPSPDTTPPSEQDPPQN